MIDRIHNLKNRFRSTFINEDKKQNPQPGNPKLLRINQ